MAVPEQQLVSDLVEALSEVREWIANWSPDFVQDEEWPATATKMDAALRASTLTGRS